MIRLNYSVIYPAVDHDNPSNDPYIARVSKQRTFTGKVAPGRCDESTCDHLFAGMNAGSQQEFPWFLQAKARSMSVGDVVALYKPDEIGARWFICDSCGWMTVNATQAQSWLDFKRKYGCCSFELSQWKKAQGLDKE